MALGLDFDVCSKAGCQTLIFTEDTGAYDATLNTTGWGAPNPVVGDADSWSIIITLPDGTTVVTITDPVGLPTSDDSLEYEIPVATLDSTRTTVQDGIYIFEYTVTIGATTYTSGTKYFLFTCNIDCCVFKMFRNIATLTDCSCDSTIIKNALYAWSLAEGLKANAGCGDTTAITSLITKLNLICGFTDSDCGCN